MLPDVAVTVSSVVLPRAIAASLGSLGVETTQGAEAHRSECQVMGRPSPDLSGYSYLTRTPYTAKRWLECLPTRTWGAGGTRGASPPSPPAGRMG